MKNRIVAALLALFLGVFGAHKFYLGHNFAGIIYLLFCWTYIPGIIAFFESIGLLLMSDRAFDAKYNSQYINNSNIVGNLQGSPRDKTAILMELKKLYDAGIITAEEYEQKRRKYLDSL
jgi:TM2 domain-containing membrane protein YozV